MAGRIWIPPYKPLGVSTDAVPGGGYINVDASAGHFGASPWMQVGLQAAQGVAGIATVVSEHLAGDNEAIVKGADMRLGEAEQALLFDPQAGYLNLQGQEALNQAPAVLDAYREAQAREMAALTDDDQRQMLQGLTERRLASFTTRIEHHSAVERQRWYDAAGEQRIVQMRTDAGLNWSDDALLRRALGTARAEVREKAQRHGWESALTETALRQETSRMLVSAIGGAVERDPGRAQDLRTRYAAHIEDQDGAALDALLSEAQTRQRAQAASTEILNATPPAGEPSTPQWRLRQAEAIAEPAVRAAATRRLVSADAEAQARTRALAEQVLARVLKDGLTDPSQVPIREWVALDTEHRQAIEARLDHNARETEPGSNPALVDELATEMTQAPHAFARRDLIAAVARLPLPQWHRFRYWQAGMRRNDPTIEDEIHAIKRGLQLATKRLPANASDDSAAILRAVLVDEIDTERRINGKSPDDTAIGDMLERHVSGDAYRPRTLEWDPRDRPEAVPMRFAFPYPDQDGRPGIHRIHDGNTTMGPSAATLAQMRALMEQIQRAVIAAQRALAAADAQVVAARAAAQAIPKADVLAASNAAQALEAAIKAREAAAREHDLTVEFDEYVQDKMRAWTYLYAGRRFTRILERNEVAEAAKLGFVPTDDAPIDAQGRQVFVNPRTGQYIVRAEDVRTPGIWEYFDEFGDRLGFARFDLAEIYPDPPLNPDFPPNAVAMTPAQKRYRKRLREWARDRDALLRRGATADQIPPPPEDPDETPEAKAKREQEEKARAKTKAAREREAARQNKKYLTTDEARQDAERMGYRAQKYTDENARGEKVFRNPDAGPGQPEYIARDRTSHKGSWKSFRMNNGKLERTGTWNADLTTRLGD